MKHQFLSICHGVEGTHTFSGKKAAQRCGRELSKRLFGPVPEDFLEHEHVTETCSYGHKGNPEMTSRPTSIARNAFRIAPDYGLHGLAGLRIAARITDYPGLRPPNGLPDCGLSFVLSRFITGQIILPEGLLATPGNTLVVRL